MIYPSLFIMGGLDLIGGILLLGLRHLNQVDVMIYQVPYSLVFFLAIALLVKGIYSIAFGFVGGS